MSVKTGQAHVLPSSASVHAPLTVGTTIRIANLQHPRGFPVARGPSAAPAVVADSRRSSLRLRLLWSPHLPTGWPPTTSHAAALNCGIECYLVKVRDARRQARRWAAISQTSDGDGAPGWWQAGSAGGALPGVAASCSAASVSCSCCLPARWWVAGSGMHHPPRDSRPPAPGPGSGRSVLAASPVGGSPWSPPATC